MPKTKGQGIIFGIIMSYAMAYGMEVYNVAIKMGVNLSAGGFSNMTNIIFWEAFKEALYMGVFVFLFSNLWGNRMGAAFMQRHCNPETDNPYFCQLMRQAGTVAIMCPTMSLVASILFNVILDIFKEFPHGIFLEYVCGGAVYALAVRQAVPCEISRIIVKIEAEKSRRAIAPRL